MNKIFLIASGIAITAFSSASSWNLQAEWSDTQNPFEVWSLYKNPTELFTANIENWAGSGNHAWAGSSGGFDHVPAYLKAKSETVLNNLDSYLGATLAHTAETERTGTEISFAKWTSPINGTVVVRGGVWMGRRQNRDQDWFLRKNGVVVTGGDVNPGLQFNAQTPLDFSTGSGGAAALTMNVSVGDSIELLPMRDPSHGSFTGDFVGFEFGITTNPVPAFLSGNIHLQNYDGDVSDVHVPIIVRRSDGEAVFVKIANQDDHGDYALPVCMNGTYAVSAKPFHWLRKTIDTLFTDSGAIVDFDLINGDVDGDNEITLVDFGQDAAAFGSIDGDPNWNPNADLDGDGEVTLVDIAIVGANFGQVGDEE